MINRAFVIAIFFLLSFTSGFAENYLFNASYVIEYVYDEDTSFNSCSDLIDCIFSDGNGNISVKPVKKFGIYYYAYIKTKTNAFLPHDISVLDVQVCVKACRDRDFSANCYIIAMENSSGTWKEEYWEFDCSEYPVNSFGVKCVNAANFFNLTKLNNSGVGWKINYRSPIFKKYRNITLDWFYINVSYIPLRFLVWQSNATMLYRGQSAEISAKWQIKDIAVAKIKHNLSGSFREYSITPEYPWTNYTVVFDNSIAPGYYEISYIYAQDSYGGYNKTFPPIGLMLYGYAKISEIIVNDSYIYPNESIKVFCKVMDANTSESLENYPVNFYLDNILVGINYTNSSGYAVMEFNISSLGWHEIKCNITNNTEMYYVIAKNKNERSEKVKVVNLSVVINLNSTSLDYGDTILVKANITNASSIVFVKLNHSFVNITDSCSLENVSVIRNMEIVKCYSPDLCEAEISFIPERSGEQNLNLCVNASSPFGIVCNTSKFSVSFGEVSSVFWIPYYFVLANQTFNITVNISSNKGDVWNVNVSLSIDGQESINISSSETWWKKIEGVKNSGTCFVRFSAYSNNTGLVKISLNSVPENGTASRFSESFEVIKPEINRNSNISFTPQNIFIDEFTLIKANIIGNASPCEVNFTVFKPWNSGNESFYYQKIEAVNPEECGVVFESGNIASLNKGATASASNGNDTATNAIDVDNSTAWSWGESAHINITFKKPDYTVERIKIRWKKIVSEDVNASIYYIDPLGNLNVFVENIPLPSNVNETIFSDFKPFKAGKIILNFTGGVSVYEVGVYPTIPRIDKCYVFSVNYTSQNLTHSGFYNTFASIITQTGNLINLKNASFFVKYGKPVLEISKYTPNALITGNPENYIVIVKAYRGDLRNFTLRWNSSNLEYLNITSKESFMKNFTFLENGNSIEVIWEINATGIPQGYSNYTVETYVSVFSELERIRENNNASYNITIYPEDNQAPVINSFWFEIKGVKTNVTNVNFTLSIIANVTDNIWVRSVNATIIYPNGYNTSVNFRKISDNIWNFTFTIDGIELNQTGNYKIRIEATDLEYNETISNFSEFNVSNKLYIFIESPVILNRGEYLNISVKDVNNLTVDCALFNFSAKAVNSNFTLKNSSYAKFFIVFINSSYPSDEYKADINASIYNNTGYLNFTFRVSSELVIEIIAPKENSVFEPGEAISGVDLPRVRVYNIRKDKEIVSDIDVNVTCLDSNSDSKTHEINYGACGIFEDTFSFSGCEAQCYAPNKYGETFSIIFTAKDGFNNSGVNSVALKTKSPPVSEEKVVSGGGGGGGVGALAPVCNCTEWKNIGCGIGFCGKEEMYQERVCTPPNCSIEARCIKHVICIIPTDFEITYLNTTSEIIKGYEKSFYLIISNLVEKTIKINTYIEAKGCEVIYEKTIILEPKTEKLYEIKVTPFLNASEYSTLKFEFSSDNITKQGTIELIIKENPVVSKINEIHKKVEKEFLQKISYLKNVGINTTNIEKKISEVKKLVEETSKYIQTNNIESLEKTFFRIQKLTAEIKKDIEKGESQVIYAIIRKNAHWIAIGFVIFVYLGYLISNVILPYIKYKKVLRELVKKERELVKARIETEKQFFMRKIDEKTFRDLIVKRQHEIISTRVKIKEVKNEMKILVRESISPVKMILWIKDVLRKVPKIIYSIANRIKEYGKNIYWRIRFR